MNRSPRRWSTRFGKWVSTFGVSRLTVELGARGQPTTVQAVHHWLAGRTTPRPDRALVISELSEGRVRVTDIYRHRMDLRR